MADFFKIAVDALFVDAFSGLQDVEVHSDGSRQVDESLHIFWKTETAVAESGFEELSADARVEPHGMGNFLDVCADFFAEIGDHIGIANFERKEGIRGVLNQLTAVNFADQQSGLLAPLAATLVHPA